MKAVIILFVMLALLWYCVPDFFSPSEIADQSLAIVYEMQSCIFLFNALVLRS